MIFDGMYDLQALNRLQEYVASKNEINLLSSGQEELDGLRLLLVKLKDTKQSETPLADYEPVDYLVVRKIVEGAITNSIRERLSPSLFNIPAWYRRLYLK